MSVFPQNLVEEVLSRMPVKSLLRFRCVSKQWRTLIDSPDFIKMHMEKSIKMGSSVEVIHRRNAINFVSQCFDLSEVAVGDAKGLSHPFNHRYDHIPINHEVHLIGSCNGLLCFVDSVDHIVLWNLATRNYFELPYYQVKGPRFPDCYCLVNYGFGYDSANDDYKVVRLIIAIEFFTSACFHGEFYSMKSNSWKDFKVSKNNFRHANFSHHRDHGISVSGAVHWTLDYFDEKRVDNIDVESPIVAFDLAKDEFMSVPCFDLSNSPRWMNLGTVHGCLCLFCSYYNKGIYELWVMKDHGVKESWTKIFTWASANYVSIRPIDHSKSKSTMILEVNRDKLAWCKFEEEEEPITEIDNTSSTFCTEAWVNHESLVGTSWNRCPKAEGII